MSKVECWYHYFWDRQACNNSAAYIFLPHIGSILTSSGFGAGCYPPRYSPIITVLLMNYASHPVWWVAWSIVNLTYTAWCGWWPQIFAIAAPIILTISITNKVRTAIKIGKKLLLLVLPNPHGNAGSTKNNIIKFLKG